MQFWRKRCCRYDSAVQTSAVPKAEGRIIEQAIHEAVKAGVVWFISGPISLYREEMPLGVLSDAATLNVPPAEVAPTALLPQNLPTAWSQTITTAAALNQALSLAHGSPLPWTVVLSAIDSAVRTGLLELAADSGPWPCDWPGAGNVRLQVPERVTPPPPPDRRSAEAELEPSELQDLVEGLSDVLKAGAGLNLRFVLRLEVRDGGPTRADRITKLNDILGKICDKLRFS